jgi:hypothetical protein
VKARASTVEELQQLIRKGAEMETEKRREEIELTKEEVVGDSSEYGSHGSLWNAFGWVFEVT